MKIVKSEEIPQYDDNTMLISVHPLCPNKDPILPPAKKGDVGFDLVMWIEDNGRLLIPPFSMQNIRTGVYVKLPDNAWGDIRPRSSTFAKRNLFVMHATIDPGYVGEISVFIWNPTPAQHMVNNGDRLAQLVIIPKYVPKTIKVAKLPDTERGISGFGSTGE